MMQINSFKKHTRTTITWRLYFLNPHLMTSSLCRKSSIVRPVFALCIWEWLHSGLRFNLILSLFLQTFNAISESEYVKIGSMCILFLISMICLSENALLYIFRAKFKPCSISIRQRLLFTNFATKYCSQPIKCLCGSVVEL